MKIILLCILILSACIEIQPTAPERQDSSQPESKVESLLSATLVVTKPNQDRAVSLIWEDVYQMVASPPIILWVEGDQLDCDGPGSVHKNNGFHGWLDWNVSDGWPACVIGTFDPEAYLIRVSWPRGTTRFSTTALAHELLHARMWRNTGEVSHQGVDFTPRGRIAIANKALKKVGL